jgi:uncharacterized membrane protein
MPVVSFNERVNAPIARIFGTMTDIPNASQFMSGIESVEMLSEGAVGVGTRWKETRAMLGKQSTEEMWITEFNENENYVVEAESCGAKYRTEFKFKSVDNYTTDVEMKMVVQPITLAAKLMSPISYFMKGAIIKAIKKDLDDARIVCQNQYADDTKSSVRQRKS